MNIVDQADLKPDRYCVRIYFRGLKQAIADEEAGKDFYRIEIWKGEKTDLDVIKAI